MRRLIRFLLAALILLGGWAVPAPRADAANLDPTADRVFGQPDFTHNTANNGGVSANSLWFPGGVTLDAQGNLYVADTTNNRVLEYDAPLTADATADRVFGQPDFTHDAINNGNPSPSANSLYYPGGVTVDVQGDLYVADSNNNRVLEYDAPLTTGMAASRVFGQPDFTHNTTNNGGLSATSLANPQGVAVDATNNLYVADYFNNRVLEYNAPLTTDTTADRVFGQPNFISNTANNGGLSANSLNSPFAVTLDSQGNLYVADTNNHRVLEYDVPLTTNTTADRVFGQPDFVSNTPNNGGVSANSLVLPTGVVVDAQGNLYVADTNNRVLEYDVPVPYGLPALTALSPSTVAAGSPAFTLTVNGSGFVAGSVVRWNGSDRATTFLGSTQLNAAISAADVASGGPFAVTVFTPAPGGGASSLMNLPLYARAGQDATADLELGQPSFISNTVNNSLLPGGANRLYSPAGVVVDPHTRRLFVADRDNNRVLSWPSALALANGQAADLVIGQPTFYATGANTGGVSAASLFHPRGLALDALGDLYVADASNNRVLEYNSPLSTSMSASQVFGQGGSFTTNLANNGGISANSLSTPQGLAVDGLGDLYVADNGNSRVLEYDTPLSTDTTADRVFGQPNFISNTANNGGLSANSLNSPFAVTPDSQGNLYVADIFNNRVLEYNTPLASDVTADRVFGQPDFTHNTANNGGVSANSLAAPLAAALDAANNLYVADGVNNRVLKYDTPLTSDATADRVFGQPDFTHNTANNGGLSANSLYSPRGVALDAANNLYVADTDNHRVLEYDWALVKLDLPLVQR